MTWLTPAAVLRLPVGAVVVLEMIRHTPRLRGRLAGRVADELTLETYGGRAVTVTAGELRRGRLVKTLFDGGDPVLRVGHPTATWRGGVVRSDGRRVLVEQIDGSFDWLDETELERPEDRSMSAKTA